MLKLPCKVWPTPQPHPAFPNETSHWAPIINVRLIYKHAPPTKSIECWVDSGSQRPVYFHKVKIMVVSEQFDTMAGFSWELSAIGILGRRGFSQNFITKIDSSQQPPSIELERIKMN